MLRDGKNLTDSQKDPLSNTDIALKDSPFPISYQKTNKLITALYMVTDIIDRDEPLRNKLRTLGAGVVSDINLEPAKACRKIAEIMSFLDIASAVNIVSAMNCNILRKEFYELDQAIRESLNEPQILNKQIDLSEFFRNELPSPRGGYEVDRRSTSLGVQKASTLLKSIHQISDKIPRARGAGAHTLVSHMHGAAFEVSKGQRRADILNIIKSSGGSATIKDIKDRASHLTDKNNTLSTLGEKTLQRELIAMVHDGVLNKIGEKRWSKYSIKISP
ncbi:MAG: hypothetical protein WCT29_03335 [Candidatus Paceibacterota bacterium]|jgi:hypothetical protein